MSWFAKISIANRWVTILIALAIIWGSIFGTLQLKTELLPDIELPYIMVSCARQGYSPEQMVDQISKPIEDEIQQVQNLKHIESTSKEGSIFIWATFEYGTDMDETEAAIIDKLEADPEFKSLLESEDFSNVLEVAQFSFEMMPIVWVTLSSTNEMTTADIRVVAEDMADELLDVEGLWNEETLFMETVQGGEEDLLVIPDAAAMNNLNIPVSWLVYTLQAQTTEYTSVEDIENTPILLDPSYTIGDVANVAQEPVSKSYTNGDPSVSVMWWKDQDANTVDVANAILSRVSEFETGEDFPEGVVITTVMDQSEYIEQSIKDLARDAIIGLVLAAIVVILFLWAFRASLIVIVSIPFSILAAFLLMWAFGITVNILTLSGLAIAVGRVVDDSIVSLENIYRHLQRGEGFRQAVIDGIREIAMPVISATVATVAIFVPLIVVGGMVGEMFRPFGLTITFALLASLVAALILVPPLSSFMGRKKVSFEGYDNWYTRIYTRILRWSLGHRAITMIITIAIFIGSIFILPLVGTSFMDTGGENVISVEINMPYGSDQDLVDTVKEVEKQIDDLKNEQGKVRNYYTYLGSMTDPTESGIASLQIDLTRDADMEQQADALRDKVEQNIEEKPNTTIKVLEAGMEAQVIGGTGLEVRVIGTEDGDLEPVQEMTIKLTDMIELELKGDIENLESELVTNQNDVSKEWKPGGIAQFMTHTGLTDNAEAIAQLEEEWALMRFGWPVTLPGEEDSTRPTIDINGNTTEIYIPGIVNFLSESETDTIRELRVALADTSNTMKLGELADIEWGPAEYRRAEGGYAGTITAAIAVDDVGAVNREVQKMIDDIEDKGLPEGVSEIKIGGIAEQMMEGFSDMSIAIGFAILIVFAIMVVSFRSWLTPLLIMVSMPLASIGAVLALLITGKTLGMSGMMGILMLVGIVLTNAIVMLTFVDDRRREGYNAHDALMDAGRIRLRPILMTALTTMIALVPLAVGYGEGVLLASELGVVVIGGLFSSTVLTLVVVPVLYSLTERLRRRAPSNSG